MIILWVLIPCLICGAFFAYIAAWLTTKKGNTISDILRSKKLVDVEAIRLEILGKVKISSNIPIVALSIVAAVVAVGLPSFVTWQLLRNVTTITLGGYVEMDSDKKIYAMPKDVQIDPGGRFDIPIIYSAKPQTIVFQGEYYKPVSLSVIPNKIRNTLSVSLTDNKPVDIPINMESKSAEYDKKIHFFTDFVNKKVPNKPSNEVTIDSKFKEISDPQGVRK